MFVYYSPSLDDHFPKMAVVLCPEFLFISQIFFIPYLSLKSSHWKPPHNGQLSTNNALSEGVERV